MDDLLKAAAYYRKRDPTEEEEAELVANVFDALSSCLVVPENQGRFRHSQGFELMVRCMKVDPDPLPLLPPSPKP